MPKQIALLGSTGSIGRQAIEVIKRLDYEVVALAAGSDDEALEVQARSCLPQWVALANPAAAQRLESRLTNMPCPPRILSGPNAAAQVALQSGATLVLNAVVGIAGLSATLAALQSGVDVALANKESLVAGGRLVMDAAAKTGARLLPVDSEHSAIFQCLQDPYAASGLQKILLTASGGPFYGHSTQQLQSVKAKDALRHPNWQMGPKITIDSATLMNKGLELIEAMWLFDVAPKNIEIVVQRESIIHSMVQLVDHSVLAQMGVPDMRLPIQYALTWPQRQIGTAPALDFSQLETLHFGRPDLETFRCLAAARSAAEKGGLAACAANGANEEAVALFLQDRIGFLEIGRLVEGCVDSDSFSGGYTLEDVYYCDAAARRYVREHL